MGRGCTGITGVTEGLPDHDPNCLLRSATVLKHGYNKFDPDRLNIVFRSDAIDRISHTWKDSKGKWHFPMIRFDAKAGQVIPRAS